MKREKQHDRTAVFTIRHALVLLTGILILLGPCALVYNTWAIFVVPVSSALDASSSQFTLYITVLYLVGALLAPLAGNLLERFDLRLVLSVSVVLVALGMALCALWSEVWQFYISGFLEGAGSVTLMFLAVPTLINRWFRKRTGLFIGLCMAMSGFGGALWSIVGGAIIASFDWRTAYAVYALLVVVLALPATLFFIRSYPREVGLMPYGEDQIAISAEDTLPGVVGADVACDVMPDVVVCAEGSHAHSSIEQEQSQDRREWGVPAKTMFSSSVFYVLMIMLGLCNALTAVANLFASYIYHLGDQGVLGIDPVSATMMASTVAACLMVSAAISKIVLGALTDKTSLGALVLMCLTAAIGIICLWQAQQWLFGVYVGAVLFGLMYAAVDSYGPAQTRKMVGPRDYTLIYSRISIVINVAGAFAVSFFTLISEISWEAEWIVTLSFVAIIFILGLVVLKLGKSLEQTYEEKVH